MPKIRYADNWKGDSDMGPNHERSLTEDEMGARVLRILAIPDITDDSKIKHPRIKELIDRLLTADGKVVVKKGERETNIHFTINVDPEAAGALHVWVAEGGSVNVPSAPVAPSGKVARVPLFTYQPVGISVKVDSVFENFPTTFKLVNGRSEKGISRPRGTSFSVGNKTTAAGTPPTLVQRMAGLVNPPPG